MPRPQVFRWWITITLGMAALSAASLSQSPATPAPSEEVLLHADRDFNKATKEKRLEGWMQFMADDVILLRAKPVFGKESVRATLKSDWDDPEYSLTWEPKRAEIFKSGKMGDTSGRWTYHGKNEKGEKITLQGDYLTVWQKQADNSWKVIYDGGTPDPAAK